MYFLVPVILVGQPVTFAITGGDQQVVTTWTQTGPNGIEAYTDNDITGAEYLVVEAGESCIQSVSGAYLMLPNTIQISLP